MPGHAQYDGSSDGQYRADQASIYGIEKFNSSTSNLTQDGHITVPGVSLHHTGEVHRAADWDEVDDRLRDHFDRYDQVLRNLA